MQPNTHLQVEDEIVDTETGEILDAVQNGTIATKDLPTVCRILRRIQGKQNTINTYLRDEIERLTAYCEAKTKPLAEQEQKMLAVAQSLLDATGERRMAYPGLGVVRYVAGRNSVNTEAWDAMTREQQIQFQNVNQQCVKVETVYKPDKKVIMERLREGAQSTIPIESAFSINEAHDHFQFMSEG